MKRRSGRRSLVAYAGLVAAMMASAGLAGCVQYTTAGPLAPLEAATVAPPAPAAAPLPTGQADLAQPWVLLSVEENGYAHFVAFDLASAAMTRLTSGDWHDITPSLSPDGNSIAFASDRGGFWDLYIMDLRSAAVSQVTNTSEYDGSPFWSPDMAWLAYETYNDGQLDVLFRSLTDPAAEPVLLTEHPASDHSPAWSPDGRKIAFVSSRTGDAEIWLADLDRTTDRFTNLSNTARAAESHPTWSRDGTHLAWAAAALSPGDPGIYVWNAARPSVSAIRIGSGTWPAWSADGSTMSAVIDAPTQQLLSAYTLAGTPLVLPEPLPGRVRGLVWPAVPLPTPLPADFLRAAQVTAPALSAATITALPDVPSKRWHIVPLQDVRAPSAGLHALVAPSFELLRERVIAETGWDPLASLENTFVPFTAALEPGLQQDWLYTGRAFAINTLMLNAGWISVAREDIGDQTYWRVFVRVQNQDGSQGAPMTDPPWDLNTRYQLDPRAYEAGGSYVRVPPGYWLDLTSLAEMYGWHRLAALPGWRTYYAGARFSELAHTGGLDWYSAMLELYPAEALVTATAVLPPTITPSRTPRPTTTPYPTWTPRATLTASRTPTPLPPTSTLPPTPTPPTVIPTFPSATP
ncbi:MAG: DPP IV N-terminal domain-containing protein [Chloroflexota bacterium]